MLMMLIGTRYFQAKFISRSTRIRGRVARIQNIRKTNPPTLSAKNVTRIELTSTYESIVEPSMVVGKSENGIGAPPPRNRSVPRQLTPKTLKYSARKKRPNRIPEYSV